MYETSKEPRVIIHHLSFYFLMMMIVIISVIRIALSIDIPVFFFLAIISIMIVICNKEELIACMCSLLVMPGILQNGIALLIVTIGVIVRNSRFNLKGAIPLTLMIIWEMLHAGQTNLHLYGFLQNFSPLFALTALLVDGDRKQYDLGFIVRSFACMTLICSLINIMACSILYGYSIFSFSRLGNLDAESQDFLGLINPNANSFFCLIALSTMLFLRYSLEEKIIDKYIIICLIGFILLTQSKAGIICTILLYLLYIYFSKSIKYFNSKKFTRLFGTIIIIGIASVLFSDLIGALINRFTAGDLSTGRTMIDLFYFRHITSNARNLLFGTGLYDYTFQMRNLYSADIWQQYSGLATMAHGSIVYKPCHLAYLEIIVVWGIPGAILVYCLFKTMLEHRFYTESKINLVTLYIYLIYCLQSEFLSSRSMLHALIVVFLIISNIPWNNMVINALQINVNIHHSGMET